MRTTLDTTAILYGLVNVSGVTTLINGAVYKDEMPANSTNQNIVCVSTTVDNEGFQTGIGYVNIHDPGIMPNHVWFKSVTDVVAGIIKAHYVRNDYHLLITNIAGPMKREGTQGYFMSIRVQFKLYYNS
ncbi:hypothetical protein [Parapedobacter soli]|uniref:hypothetical protein n=1 Tax=Parapedobacter soli TaxID=416955 RepID=UPI0021C6AAE9|nr:hypothetical protein [Parapedobacter soli]